MPPRESPWIWLRSKMTCNEPERFGSETQITAELEGWVGRADTAWSCGVSADLGAVGTTRGRVSWRADSRGHPALWKGAGCKPNSVQIVEFSSTQSIPWIFISIWSVCILDNIHSHDSKFSRISHTHTKTLSWEVLFSPSYSILMVQSNYPYWFLVCPSREIQNIYKYCFSFSHCPALLFFFFFNIH